MDAVPEAVRAFLDREVPSDAPLLTGFSGGADSTAMLLALCTLGRQVTAVHVHHALRGAEAERDAAFCEEFCARHGIPFILRRVSVRDNPNGRGIEGAARSLRYAVLAEEAVRRGIRYIAVAHNATDALETALFNLARGTGAAGLGIAPVRELPDGLILLRPVLRLTREALCAYLDALGESYVEDSSNAGEDAARNILRHEAIPALLRVNERAAEHALDAFERLRADDAVLRDMARALLDGDTLSARSLREVPQPVAARAVRLLYGGDDLTARHIEAVLALCAESTGHAAADLPRCRAVREYDMLRMLPREAPAAIPPTPLPAEGTVTLPEAGLRITVTKLEKYARESAGVHKIYVDSDAIHGILIVRSRRTGDRIALPGRGSRTLKKSMIDAKIPASARDAVPVIECGGQVAAAAGLGTDRAFAPRDGAPALEIRIDPIELTEDTKDANGKGRR